MSYGIIGLFLVLILVWFLAKRREQKIKGSIDFIEDFIESDVDRCSVSIVQNGKVIRDHRSSALTPIVGIYQIIIAIEYAERIVNGNLEAEELISFDQLDDFYIPKSDGGAHMAWFKSISRSIENGGISLKEVVKGMLHFNSMANTEFLCHKIGLTNINQRLKKLALIEHSDLNYPVSSLLIGPHLFPGLKGEELQNVIENMTDEEYSFQSAQIHQKLVENPTFKEALPEADLDAQKIWSDRLVKSTAKTYQDLMGKLNKKVFFSKEMSEILAPLLEELMQRRASSRWLQHAGQKINSSAYALSQILYATDLEGNTTEMAIFFNNLSIQENTQVLRAMPAFELKILNIPRKKER